MVLRGHLVFLVTGDLVEGVEEYPIQPFDPSQKRELGRPALLVVNVGEAFCRKASMTLMSILILNS